MFRPIPPQYRSPDMANGTREEDPALGRRRLEVRGWPVAAPRSKPNGPDVGKHKRSRQILQIPEGPGFAARKRPRDTRLD